MQTQVDSDEPNLRSHLEVLRRHRWIVVAAVVAAITLGLGISLIQTPLYRASTEVLLESRTPQQLLDPSTGVETDPARRLQNEIEFIESDAVTAAVKAEMNSPAEVSFTARDDADIIEISATSDEATLAADTANTYAEIYLRERRTQSAQDYQRSVEVVNAQIRQLDGDLANMQSRLDSIALQLIAPAPDAPVDDLTREQAQLQQMQGAMEGERADLQGTARQLELSIQLLSDGTTAIAQRASVPSSPFSPQWLRNVALAGVLGLILGVGAVFLREYFDDSVRTKDDVERATGLPVLALLPRIGTWKIASDARLITVEEPKSPPAEAYRGLRTAIQFMGIDNPLRVVVVTSSRPGEGKTTVTANLAMVLAQSGQKVLAVDCDLRKPRLHQFFGLAHATGFTTALIEGPPQGALHEVARVGPLSIMPSGVIPPDPAELLASKRTVALFEMLVGGFDVIVVDSPPLLEVTDALVLSRLADAVVLVTSARRGTPKSDLHRSIELLSQVGAPVIGALLNDVDSEVTSGYGYGYGADGYSSGGSTEGHRSRRKTTPGGG